MSAIPQHIPEATKVDQPPDQATEAVRTILVVDDSRAQRRLLGSSLLKQGYRVLEAASGIEALEICASEDIDLILSDWMMPGMNGLEFCKTLRELPGDKYIYFILLTSKTEKGAVAQGLDVGADDFLPKPVNPEELRARINAGARVLAMQKELQAKNNLVSSTLAELQCLYDSLDRDLLAARKMQLALVRETYRDFIDAEVSQMLQPSGHVGGDLVGYFRIDSKRMAFYSIDVSGHGIASALLTARLASYLSDGSPGQNIALEQMDGGVFGAKPPEDVAAQLNNILIDELQSEHYFTMVLAYLNLHTGKVEYTQCGHPNPVILRKNGSVDYIGTGGMPVGLINGATFERQSVTIAPGERLVLYSDGFTECENAKGDMLDEDGFATLLTTNHNLTNEQFFEALVWGLDAFAGSSEFGDDLSCIMMSYKGVQT
ncbi:PP2C family protein-serine/threonine phosphatase [Aliiroseovarius marinus]|uniref:PP2C family protein-serine/threonine phosphatase n=1 Tax=Aliiroseovarius marinus TaxID=2500159 RepID=UPI003D7EDA0F